MEIFELKEEYDDCAYYQDFSFPWCEDFEDMFVGAYYLYMSEFARYVTLEQSFFNEDCLKYVENDFAIITIQVTSSVMDVYQRDISLTIADKVGIFGELS